MASITVQPELLLERILTLEIVRVTERAAVSAARLRGRGLDKASDQAAVDAMRRELNKLPIDGTVVIGEGEIDEAPMLFIGVVVNAMQSEAMKQEAAEREAERGMIEEEAAPILKEVRSLRAEVAELRAHLVGGRPQAG